MVELEGQIMIKYEWRKQEKEFYLPKNKPELITIPRYQFFTLEGKGNPNDEAFSEAIGVLYSLSFGIKMMPKQGITPTGYFEYTVYPLEGLWDLSDAGKAMLTFDKNELVYKIMIRQPDFVNPALAYETIESVKIRKPHPLLDQVKFESIEDGLSVQMLHLGSYDNEPQSFALMNAFCETHGLIRTTFKHREIYLSDFRKTAAEKLKTTLRYFVEEGSQ